MTVAAIRESLAMLSQLKHMNPRRIGAQRIEPRLPYVRSVEEQERMNQIALEIEKLKAGKPVLPGSTDGEHAGSQ